MFRTQTPIQLASLDAFQRGAMAPTDQFSPNKDAYSEYDRQSLQPDAGETVKGYPITSGASTPETIQ